MTAFAEIRWSVLSSARSLGVLAVAASIAASVPAQNTQPYLQRIDALRSQIKTAEQQHTAPEEVGRLWLQLANRYQDQLEFPQAEDAFARSLRLLHSPDTQVAYANALNGMGSLYLEMGRLEDALDYSRKSIEIYTALGDTLHAATLHTTIALAQLFAHRYREAESESAEGIAEIESLPQPDAGEQVAGYLAHSYALCGQGRCRDALSDVNRAMFVGQAHLRPDSAEMAAVWLARGYVQWKVGSPDDADQAMGAALHILRGRTDLPQPLLANLEFGLMRQYDAFLKATHRKPEARQLEAEMTQLQAQHPQPCSDCTVSVATLGLMP